MLHHMLTRSRLQAFGLFTLCLIVSGCEPSGSSVVPRIVYLPSTSATTQTNSNDGNTTTNTQKVEGFGTISGRILLDGAAAQKNLYPQGGAPKDTEVCGAAAIPDESIVSESGGLGNVVIFLDKIPAGLEVPPPTDTVMFDQLGCVFKPHVMIVRTTQALKVLNDDTVAHNTRNNPKKNKQFNKTVNPKDRDGVELIYTRPEPLPISVGCDFHSWMTAYHFPIDHPYVAVTKPDGSFEIPSFPAGKHKLKIWHEKGGVINNAWQIDVKPDAANQLEEFKIPLSKLGG